MKSSDSHLSPFNPASLFTIILNEAVLSSVLGMEGNIKRGK
jgi:hypothetical protein